MTTFDKILAGGIITIIRGLDSDHAEKTVEAIFAGGLRLAEILSLIHIWCHHRSRDGAGTHRLVPLKYNSECHTVPHRGSYGDV